MIKPMEKPARNLISLQVGTRSLELEYETKADLERAIYMIHDLTRDDGVEKAIDEAMGGMNE